jgi:hypothetical protein
MQLLWLRNTTKDPHIEGFSMTDGAHTPQSSRPFLRKYCAGALAKRCNFEESISAKIATWIYDGLRVV